jgi:hypothetical protein
MIRTSINSFKYKSSLSWQTFSFLFLSKKTCNDKLWKLMMFYQKQKTRLYMNNKIIDLHVLSLYMNEKHRVFFFVFLSIYNENKFRRYYWFWMFFEDKIMIVGDVKCYLKKCFWSTFTVVNNNFFNIIFNYNKSRLSGWLHIRSTDIKKKVIIWLLWLIDLYIHNVVNLLSSYFTSKKNEWKDYIYVNW